MNTYYLAVDIGASSGRHILGHVDNGKLCLEEIYRFENGMTSIPGVFAAGDAVSGPKTVVEAVAYTKKVSEQMIKYCNEKRGLKNEK